MKRTRVGISQSERERARAALRRPYAHIAQITYNQFQAGGHVFLWNGGHTVNVRAIGGRKDLDCFSVGDFAQSAASVREVVRGIAAWLESS